MTPRIWKGGQSSRSSTPGPTSIRATPISESAPSPRKQGSCGQVASRWNCRRSPRAHDADHGPLDLGKVSVPGKTLREDLECARVFDKDFIRPLLCPSMLKLRGNLAPREGVIKPSGCSARFQTHRHQALVFQSNFNLRVRIDDPDLDVTEDTVLVLPNAGAVAGPGMGDCRSRPSCCARACATPYTCPTREGAGGATAPVSVTSLSKPMSEGRWPCYAPVTSSGCRTLKRRIDMVVSEVELDARRAAWLARPPPLGHGFGMMSRCKSARP